MIIKERCLLIRWQVLWAFMLVSLLASVKASAQGLQFNSNDSLLNKRTSYLVFKKDQPTFKDHLYVSFDLALWDNEHLGYILNLTDQNNNSYSLSSIYYNNVPYLNFNIDSKSNKLQIPLRADQLQKRSWMKVKLAINLAANKVVLTVDGKGYEASGFEFNGKLTPKIYFGKNEHYFDVPKMAIRDLQIADDEKNYRFPLDEWSGNKVYDSNNEETGYVENPVWLINESYFWAPKTQQSFKEVAGINFDPLLQKLLIYKSDSLITYDVQRNNIAKQAYQNRCPIPLHLGKSIINTRENKLYAYETLKPNLPAPSIASLDLSTLKWAVVGRGTISEQRHHHNIFYDKDQGDFYLFGGYGSYFYYKDFFRYNKHSDTWDKVSFKGDEISPRFFSGYSVANESNEVYIFGGYGNQSGNQVIGGQHFYDLYKVNLTTHTIKKCWQIKPPAEDFVAANNLILSDDKNYFYAICYAHDKAKTSLRLYRFSIRNGSYEAVSGTIPAKGERIESDINLFYNKPQNTFYCAIQEFTTPDYSTVRIYSLAAPPVTEAAYKASQNGKVAAPKNYKLIVWLIAAAAAAGAIWFIIRKRKAVVIKPDQLEMDSSVFVADTKKDDKRLNSVYLLGDFTVYDKNGRDITYLFSPKIKLLFILILLSSKNDEGISSRKISAILWPDKDLAKTKNIKGVTINHLRNNIVDIDGIELAFENDTYSFKISENFFCDYYEIDDAVKRIKSTGKAAAASILNEFDLIARGNLLPQVSGHWIDEIRMVYEEALLELVVPEIEVLYEARDYKKVLDITRIVLNIDPFNDVAIKFKLKSLRRLKGIEFARKQYETFAADYQRSLGVAYNVPFEKICTSR